MVIWFIYRFIYGIFDLETLKKIYKGDIWYDALNETKLSVMFVYGPADPINPADRFPKRLRADIPAIKLRVLSEMVGHYPQLEDHFTVYGLIKSFLWCSESMREMNDLLIF